MRSGDLFKTWRGWSWLFGVLSLMPAGFGVYESWQFSRWAAERTARGEFTCGTGFVMVQLLCAVAALAFAVIASACGGAGYFRLPRPRPGKRALEVVIVAGVAVLGLLVFLSALIGKALP